MRFLQQPHHYICTFFVFAFLYILQAIPAQFDSLDPIGRALADFELTDVVFSQIRKEPPPDTNIVLVNIKELDRAGIGRQVQILSKYNPKVIGIDAFFRKKKSFEQDIQLIMSLSQVPNLVMVSELTYPNEDATCFDSLATSHPQFNQFGITGFANMKTAIEGYKTTREFVPSFCVGDSTELSFAAQIVKYYDSTKVEPLLARGREVETINWRGNYTKFFRLDAEEVLEENFDPSLIEGKIVLLGFLGTRWLGQPSLDDTFFTPLNDNSAGKAIPDMFGVTLHANIISMILHANYIQVIPLWLSIVIAFILVFLNVSLFFFIGSNYKVYYDLITKSLQLVEVIILLAISIVALLIFNWKMDLTLAIIAIIFSGDLTELYVGSLKPLGERAVRKILGKA